MSFGDWSRFTNSYALALTPLTDVVNVSMPEYIDTAVTRLRDSSSNVETTLLIGVSGDRDEVAARIEESGGIVNAQLGRATLRVTVPESIIDDLCELDGLKSIEIEREDVRTLDEGNGRSRRRVTRS